MKRKTENKLDLLLRVEIPRDHSDGTITHTRRNAPRHLGLRLQVIHNSLISFMVQTTDKMNAVHQQNGQPSSGIQRLTLC